jgi:hypothetical protein
VRKNSTNLYFHRYLIDHEWKKIMATDVEMGEKETVLVDAALRSGQPWPNEGTIVGWASILLYASHVPHRTSQLVNINAMDAAHINKELKEILKNRRKHRFPNVFDGVILTYPPNPATLKETHPGWFEAMYAGHSGGEENLPAVCPLNESVLEQIRGRLPARNTHSSVKQQNLTMANFSTRHSQPIQQVFEQVAAYMAAQRNVTQMSETSNDSDGGVPGFRILKDPVGRSCFAVPPNLAALGFGPSSMQLPALMPAAGATDGAPGSDKGLPALHSFAAITAGGMQPPPIAHPQAGQEPSLPKGAESDSVLPRHTLELLYIYIYIPGKHGSPPSPGRL